MSKNAKSPPRSETSSRSPGSKIGPYTIRGELGRGGAGVVYRAEDPSLSREVAIKILHPHLAVNPQAAARFLREGKAAGAVYHDNLVPVFHVGKHDGLPYLVMPLLKGDTLAARINQAGRLSVAEALRIACEIAAGLAAAHAAGFMHRDLKPANVWLEDAQGTPGPPRAKVLDFGMARPLVGETLTILGSVLGTPNYMAPEQAAGERVDPRADVYSLGATLFHMLAGAPPYIGNGVAVLSAIAAKDPPPLHEVQPSVPRGVSELVAQFLARDPRQRPADGGSALSSLRQLQMTADNTVTVEKTTSDSAPHPRSVWLWRVVEGVACVLVLCGVAVWLLSGPRTKATHGEPDQKRAKDEHTSNQHPAPNNQITLTGEGSSFVDPMMQRWGELYKQKTGVTIRYAKTGSIAGVSEFLNRRVLFCATDAFLTDEELLAAKSRGEVVHIPIMMGAVVVTYNLPTVKQPLKFTGGVLADIYLGKITKWNHPAIEACNIGVKLPEQDIIVVHRKDGSGTTSIWTDYLDKVSGAWKKSAGGPGVGNLVAWPVGVPANKNDGVAQAVQKEVGTIGYLELGYALAQNLPIGWVQNQNSEYVTPSLATVTAAAAGRMKDVSADLRFTLTDSPGKGAYPIAGITWAIVFREQLDENKQLANFFRWVIHDGQTYVAELKYAPLPPELVRRIDALLAEQ